MRSLKTSVLLAGIAALLGGLCSGCFDPPPCADCSNNVTTGTAGTGGTGATGGTGGISGMGGMTGVGGVGGSMGTTTITAPPLMCEPSTEGMANPAVDEGCGVFVSSSTGDDALGDGKRSNPFKTIAKALQVVGVERVYLCAEDFPEAVTFPDTVAAEVTLFGGLDCAMPDWPWNGDKKSRIAPAAGAVPLTVDPMRKLHVEDVAFESAKAIVMGSSSIAIIADGGSELTLTRCDVRAGDAKDGEDGVPPMRPAYNPDGVIGADGADACSDATVPGGVDIKNQCEVLDGTDDSKGGAGGAGKQDNGGAGDTGTPVDMGDGAMPNGGSGQIDASTQCTNGGVGKDGTNGAHGSAGEGLGSISNTGYKGADGGSGAAGKPGQGGGGGGGSKGEAVMSLCTDPTKLGGASGGSGGAGGCGGKGGGGGKAGGASIGIVSLGAMLKLASVTITAGKGGKGGNGTAGQPGGTGGDGGTGGAGVTATPNSLQKGCDGGKGGKGGNGGAGGGGRGGHSIGIAYTGSDPDTSSATITTDSPGSGGAAGMGPNNGVNGVQAEIHLFPTP